MAKADYQATVAVDLQRFWNAIIQYEDYPSFVEGCSGVKVERKGPGKARCAYTVSMMKEVHYTLDHDEDRSGGKVCWKLVDSDFFKMNTGQWELRDAGGGKTDVRYVIEVEFKIPVPGFILNRLVKGSLPSMVKSFEKRALASA